MTNKSAPTPEEKALYAATIAACFFDSTEDIRRCRDAILRALKESFPSETTPTAPLLPGLRAAMRAIEQHRDNYAYENGSVDQSTNAYEARREVMERLEVLDDAIEIINKRVKKEAT